MARRSRMSILKRQRELKKAEKAASKRAKRHGVEVQGFTEPQPTIGLTDLLSGADPQAAKEDPPSDPDQE